MKEIKLSSGFILKITPATFSDANALYKEIASECKAIKMSSDINENLIKDVMCILISSDKIESCIWKCFERCTYNGIKIETELFEDEKTREVYFSICKEVMLYNVAPFLKSLYSEFVPLVEAINNIDILK